MSNTDYILIAFGAYGLFMFYRISDVLNRIAASMRIIETASSMAGDNSRWLERLSERLEMIEIHTDSASSTLSHMAYPPKPNYRD